MFIKMKSGGGREKDTNFLGENSHITSSSSNHNYNLNHVFNGVVSSTGTNNHNNNNISGYHYNHVMNGFSDVGSSSMVPPFDHSNVDQFSVGSTLCDSSSWYNGGGGGVMMDEQGLSREFQRMSMDNRVADCGGFSVAEGNVAKIRPSNGENFGFASNWGCGGGGGGLYRDERRVLGQRQRGVNVSESVGSNSAYGGIGNCLIDFPLDESIHHQGDVCYDNGVPILRGNRLYGDRNLMYDGSDYVGTGVRVPRVNELIGNGGVSPRGDGGYGNDIPCQVGVQSIYGSHVVDDPLQQYIMAGCKEVLDSWANSQNMSYYKPYSNEAFLNQYGGQVYGEGDLNSIGSSQIHTKQALSRGSMFYNSMREKMRAAELRNCAPPVTLMKKTRQPYSGEGNLVAGNHLGSRRKSLLSGNTMQSIAERAFGLNGSLQRERSGGIGSPATSCDSDVLQTIYSSLAEAQGNIYFMSKDQHGCRFLQKKFDEGSFEDVQIIFSEIIDHVVELMMNPFGNYLIQKLLDVCNEEQRMKIVHVVTRNRGELVKISLNTHGTRVVQKLIESLKTRKQISLIIRALEPGFLDLIKDLNGNHVVQRCLQCLSIDDNKFIFDAAARFCVEIATHRHGCCVLQRCIAHSNGEHRKKLIEEICTNGLILAQDPFGNYVVQYIIELKIPSAAAQLTARFEGHYVHLSMQKFSSHVVEKCLKYIEDSQPRIVYEFLSVPHFEQLLQDPFANYVIQSALEVTKGALNDSLVAAVRPHSILRTNPHCKKIFTRGLLKK